jgi:hypothetical protein
MTRKAIVAGGISGLGAAARRVACLRKWRFSTGAVYDISDGGATYYLKSAHLPFVGRPYYYMEYHDSRLSE